MPFDATPRNIPMIMLYNVDPAWTSAEQEEVVGLSKHLGQALIDVGHPTIFVPVADDDIEGCLQEFDPREYLVFNWCESLPGVAHSEWMVARLLEKLGFTFTGADSETLLLAQDKFRVKELLEQAGIPTPAWGIFHAGDAVDWDSFPAIVKPVNEHCSAGITRDAVTLNLEELRRRVPVVQKAYTQPVLVEDFIDGREFHVSVWGNETVCILPVAEMDFSFFGDVKDRLCTYDAKFVPGSPHYEKIETLLPAPLSASEQKALEAVCFDAYRALGCRDYARMDIRLQDGVFYVLDINPNADISHEASMACAAETAGLSYGQMGSRIVQMAARRHPVFGMIRPPSAVRRVRQ